MGFYFTFIVIIRSEERLIKVIDPITFIYESDSLKYTIDNIYRFENKKRKIHKIASPIFKLRINCLKVTRVKKEKLEEGKLFLQEVILNRQKENYRFTDTWNFVRGPDINGVNLIEPDYYLLSKKNYLDIKNEIIKNNYAELLETCFSCAPRGQPWKIRWDHVDQVKYKGFSHGYYLIPNEDDQIHLKKLCGQNTNIFSQEDYDWMLPRGIYKYGVFGEN